MISLTEVAERAQKGPKMDDSVRARVSFRCGSSYLYQRKNNAITFGGKDEDAQAL